MQKYIFCTKISVIIIYMNVKMHRIIVFGVDIFVLRYKFKKCVNNIRVF